MNFLHILANFDAYHASLMNSDAGEKARTASSVRFANDLENECKS